MTGGLVILIGWLQLAAMVAVLVALVLRRGD